VSCFFYETLISKTASWVKLFFSSSHKDISWNEARKKIVYCSFFLISLSTMHEVVGETILSNIFSKTQVSFV